MARTTIEIMIDISGGFFSSDSYYVFSCERGLAQNSTDRNEKGAIENRRIRRVFNYFKSDADHTFYFNSMYPSRLNQACF